MYKIYYLILFTVVCIIGVGCLPRDTDGGAPQPANHKDDEQGDKITNWEQCKVLLWAQNYQCALDMMPQVENELLERAKLLDSERSSDDAIRFAIRHVRLTYCYLYMTLGKDEEALQKMMEFELPIDDDPNLAYMDCRGKILIMERLGMVDEIIDELNTILNNPDVGNALLETGSIYFHAQAMIGLICAQIKKGDFESARHNINQCWSNLRRWPTHIDEVQQQFRCTRSRYFFALQA
jgi:hypothetical protein